MSDVQNTTTVAETPTTEPTTTTQPTESKVEEVSKAEPSTDAPAAESSKPEETETATETKDEIAPVEEKKDEAPPITEKSVAPITEGQLAVKGPGLLKSIIPSKKEFWLSDDAVSPQDLNSYMRGEKPEIAHPVVAWASQTGKGLLFFNKKGDTTRKQPGHVLALYDATDLKKQSPHEIVFKLNSQEHVLKAANDTERDGWYMSIEKAIEIGKASKEETRDTEGYKAEMEKLNKPNVAVGGAAAGAKRSQSQPKKSSEVEKPDATQRKNSDIEDEDKKDKKSRSASRGMLERLKPKKEEKNEEKEEKKVEQEESKLEEENKTVEAAAGLVAAGGVAGGVAAAEGTSSEDKKEETTESPVDSTTKTEEKPKPSKRGSIFGKMQAGFGSMRSPTKEKEQKDAELKPEVPPKDEPVSENPPQIPDTTTEPAEPAAEESKTEAEAKPETTEEKKEATTPGKEKTKFLSGLSFMGKRDRSASPSTAMKDAPAKTEASPVEVPKEAEPVEEGKTDEAIAETTAVEPLKPGSEEPTSKTEKRQSVLGSLGRRASKAFKGMQTPKKENAAPATETKKEETTEVAPVEDKPTTNGETKPAESQPQNSIGDVVPDAITAGKPEHQPAAVTASA